VSLYAAWESVRGRWNIEFDEFAELTKDWVVEPVVVDGKEAGAVLINGVEMHACILPFAQCRWFGKRMYRLINEVIDKHGYAQTHATTQDGIRFIERLGFKKHGESYRRSEKWALKQS
jgi:GNAT superfamily N-acetyltransferase